MPAGRAPSRIRTALLVTLVILVGAAALAAGVPTAIAILATSGIGTAIIAGDIGKRRSEGAAQQSGGAIARYPLAFPCERVRTKGALHPRFLPSVKAVYATGVLCVAAGEAEFFPSSERYADKAWRGRIERTEITKTPWPLCFVRLHASDGTAQFALQLPAKDARNYLDPYLDVED